MVSVEDAKKSAAIRAVDNYVKVSNQILNENLYLVRNWHGKKKFFSRIIK